MGTILNPDNPNLQTISVGAGTYTVEGISSDCRNNRETHTVTELTTSGQNPILPFADNSTICIIDSAIIPELYLCGDESRALDNTGTTNASTVEWQRLDTSSCEVNPVAGCPNTNTDCNWVTIGTDPVLTLNGPDETAPTAGEYRISIVFANTCTEFYYFNVYQNTEECDLSISTIQEALDATVYPNPTTGPLTITKPIDHGTILDINGKVVYDIKASSFMISHLQRGIYFLRVRKGNKTGMTKIVKK